MAKNWKLTKQLETKLKIYKNLEIKLEIYKNVENKLEIYSYFKREFLSMVDELNIRPF